MRRRKYNADTMRSAVDLVNEMRKQVPLGQSIPGVLSPKTSSSSAAKPEEEMPEVLQAHCIHCHREGRAEPGKSTMRVEGEQKMPNGAIRKYGTCTHAQCGGKMSTLVSGKAQAA